MSAKQQNMEYVKDEIFIRFENNSTESQKAAVLKTYKLKKVRSFLITKAILFQIESEIDAADLVKTINKLPIVKYADLNRFGYEAQSIAINDPGFPYQWYLSGDFHGEEAETIKWKEAMELYSPKKNTVVAVIDSGIANFHPELEFQIAGMLAEQTSNGGVSGRDDDGFGKIDDTHGWNFTANLNNNEVGNFPEDDNGHGTLVSGIISSESNNSLGFTAVAPDSLILPLRVQDGKSISDARIIEAIEYSIVTNVKIINISMRFISSLKYSLVLKEAAQNLHLSYDCLLVCAAGNDEKNNDLIPTYPASYEGDAIISVAASDYNNELAKFSNFGQLSVDIAAPGVDIWGPTISRNQVPVFAEYFDHNLGEWLWGSTPYNLSNYYWNYFVDAYGKTWVTDSDYDVNYNLLNYSPYSDTFLKSPIINLKDVNFPELSVTVYHDLAYNWLLGSYDMLFFEVSIDGVNWSKIGSVYGKTPYPGRRYSFDLSEFEDELVEIRFRLSSDEIYQSDGVYIDDFVITGTSPFVYTGNEYKSNDGTSFAAPIVSGLAAMLLSHRPELSTQDVRKIILQSVTKVDGLADKVASGGIVNAYEAIKLANTWEIETSTPAFFSFSSSVSPSNAGSVLGTGSYESGSSVSISATPINGYEFSHWSGDASGSNNPLSITINQNTSIVANFTEVINSYSLSTSSSPSNSGTVSGDGTYNSGSTISISATPSNGYQFSHWSGDTSGSSNPLSITINQDTSIVANFTEVINSYSLSTSSSPSNSGTVSGDGTYNSGSTISISATPSNGYQFSYWSGDASGSSNPLSITINQDTSIVANFSVTGTNNTSDNNSWSSAVNLGNGWRSFSWFGEFFEVSQNWIYHLNLGWLYRNGDDLNLIWIYSPNQGWLFTSKSIYPYLYKHNVEYWLYSSDNNILTWNGSKWNSI